MRQYDNKMRWKENWERKGNKLEKRNTMGELNIVFAAVKSREKTEKTKSIMWGQTWVNHTEIKTGWEKN